MSRGYCLVPKRIIDNNLEIKYIYREQPDSKDDSGWRFFEGKESDDFVKNSDNMGLYDIETILEKDPSIPSYIKYLTENIAFEKVDGEWKFIYEDTTPENERAYFKDAISDKYFDFRSSLLEIKLPWNGETFYVVATHYAILYYIPYPMNWFGVSLPSICFIKGYFTKSELEDFYKRLEQKEQQNKIDSEIIKSKIEIVYKQLLLLPNIDSIMGEHYNLKVIDLDCFHINFSVEKNMYCITKYKDNKPYFRYEKNEDNSFEKYYSEKAEDIVNKIKEIFDIK